MSKPIRVIAVGDLSFNGRYRRLLARRGPEAPFRRVLPAWRDADLRLGNLESPITDAPRAVPSKLTLRAAPGAAASLGAAGIDCVSLANNHMMDYGPQGLADTRSALDAVEIRHVGAGANAVDAAAPVVLRRDGQAIGVFGFCLVEQKSPLYAGQATPGVAMFDVEDAVRRVHDLRPQVDWVVIQIHWGVELSCLPTPDQRRWARRMAEAGADLIVGHHPHVLQPFEMIGATAVFYSLGNFLFSDMYWRGLAPGAAPFLTKLRLHPLSGRTGWADVTLERGRPPAVRFQPARLGSDLVVRPEPTASRRDGWADRCSALHAPGYEARVEQEARRARERMEWASAWRPLQRRIEMRFVDYGLAPFAVIGD